MLLTVAECDLSPPLIDRFNDRAERSNYLDGN